MRLLVQTCLSYRLFVQRHFPTLSHTLSFTLPYTHTRTQGEVTSFTARLATNKILMHIAQDVLNKRQYEAVVTADSRSGSPRNAHGYGTVVEALCSYVDTIPVIGRVAVLSLARWVVQDPTYQNVFLEKRTPRVEVPDPDTTNMCLKNNVPALDSQTAKPHNTKPYLEATPWENKCRQLHAENMQQFGTPTLEASLSGKTYL